MPQQDKIRKLQQKLLTEIERERKFIERNFRILQEASKGVLARKKLLGLRRLIRRLFRKPPKDQ